MVSVDRMARLGSSAAIRSRTGLASAAGFPAVFTAIEIPKKENALSGLASTNR